MNYISDILYWISTGLLVPVIVLLIILFGRSVLKLFRSWADTSPKRTTLWWLLTFTVLSR